MELGRDNKKITGRLGRAAAVALLLLVTAAVYWPVHDFQFVSFDDTLYVTDNNRVREGLSVGNAAWAFTATAASNYHPLTWLSHLADVQLFGLNAGRHHQVSLLFHLLNTLLLLLVLQRLTGAFWRSFWVAALFGLHPLHVESVAWVSERKDVLSAFFWLLTMWSYGWYAERPGKARYLSVFLFLGLGLLAKPMLVTLPFVLLLLDYWPLGRLRKGQTEEQGFFAPRPITFLLLEKVPLLGLSLASSVATYLVQQQSAAMVSLETFPFPFRLANGVVAYAAYMGKTIWPTRLAAFYPHPATDINWPAVGGALFLLAFISWFAVRRRRQIPFLLVGWLWFTGTLVPVLGLVQVGTQAMADRYTYIPLIGLFIVASWGWGRVMEMWPSGRRFLTAASIVVILVLLPVTRKQVNTWRDSETLFAHALTVTEDNYLAHNSVGVELESQDRLREAAWHYREALRIKPDYVVAHSNLGVVLARQGSLQEAISHFSEALAIRPQYAIAHSNWGIALEKQGRLREAMFHYKAAIAADPDNQEGHYNLGLTLLKQGRLTEAAAHFSEALRISPTLKEARNNLGLVYMELGRLAEAVEQLQVLVNFEPNFIQARYNLALALSRQGRFAEADDQYTVVLRLNPNDVNALYNFGVSLAARERYSAAATYLNRALRVAPDFKEAHNSLGNALVMQGRTSEAVKHYREALRLDPGYGEAQQNLQRVLDRSN